MTYHMMTLDTCNVVSGIRNNQLYDLLNALFGS